MILARRTIVSLTASLIFTLWPQAGRAADAGDSKVLATVDGSPITEAEVRATVQGKLIELESQVYEAKKQGVDALIASRLLTNEAQKRNVTVTELLDSEVQAKVQDPSPAEVEALYNQYKEQLKRPLEEVRPALVEHLRNQKMQARRAEFVQQLRDKASVAVNLKPPVVDVPGTGPSRGPADAPVTIIEFSDFQCPYCGRAEASVQQVLSAYKGKVRLIFRDYPLTNIHPHAQKAAEAARCAGDQGKYWEYHATLFQNQRALAEPDLHRYAADLKLDKDKFTSCLQEDKYAETVQKDIETGESVGVSGTPAFFVNGRFLSGALPFEAFKEIIDEILKEKAKPS